MQEHITVSVYLGNRRSKPGVGTLGKLLTQTSLKVIGDVQAMRILSHFPAFAQQEYRIPSYVPKHFDRISNKYTKLPIFPVGLWCETTPNAAWVLRQT